MYYYEIQDVNGVIIKQDTTPYDTGTLAVKAAKDDLAAMYPPDYPVEVRIYDELPSDPLRYCSSTYYLSEEDIRQYALSKIDWHNRPELQDIIRNAVTNYEYYKSMWEQGKMTPKDFASYASSLWAQAEHDVESKG